MKSLSRDLGSKNLNLGDRIIYWRSNFAKSGNWKIFWDKILFVRRWKWIL